MDRSDMLLQLQQYNQTLSSLCTPLEKKIAALAEQKSIYGFYIDAVTLPDDVETFLRQQNHFKRLLPNHHEKLCHYLRHMHEWTCRTQLIRMDARSKHFSYYERKVVRAIAAFYAFYGTDMTMQELVYGQYRQLQVGLDVSAVIAERLLDDDPQVIAYCMDVLTSENNTAVLTRDVIVAIEQSHHQQLQKVLTQVFLAARLQEGLRQQVVETADENDLDYFLQIIDCIGEHDLLRYSSIQRGIMTWIGIGYEIAKEKDVSYMFQRIQAYIRNSSVREQALYSDNPLDIYIALYCMGIYDVDQAIQKALLLLNNNKRHIVACALIYLKMTNGLAIQKLLPYIKQYRDDEWIMALFISECCRYDIKKLHLSQDAVSTMFDVMEGFAKTMKSQQTYTAKGFGWFFVTLYKSTLCHHLVDLLKLSPQTEWIKRFLPYTAGYLHGEQLEYFMTKCFPLLDIETKKAFMRKEIISNNDELGCFIEKAYETLSLSDDDIRQLEARLTSKKAKARAHIVNILAKQSQQQVQNSYQRLMRSTAKTIQESALELQRKAPQYFTEKEASIPIYGKEEGYGLYTPKQAYHLPYVSKLKTIKKGWLIKKESIDFSTILPWNKAQVLAYFKMWSQRIIQHQDDEYYNGYAYKQIKSDDFHPLQYGEHSLKALPLSDVWEAYFKEDALSLDVLFELRFLLEGIPFERMLNIQTPLFTLYEADVKSIPYYHHITMILSYYFYEFEACSTYRETSFMLLEIILRYCNLRQYKKTLYADQQRIESLHTLFSFFIQQLHLEQADDPTFQEYFPIMTACYDTFNLQCIDDAYHKFTISPMLLARGALLGLVPKEMLYEGILDTHNPSTDRYAKQQHQLTEAYRDAYFEGTGFWKKPHFDLATYHLAYKPYDLAVVAYLREQLDVIAKHLIDMEKTRLNEKTAVTTLVESLYVVHGVSYLIDAARVMEHESFQRQGYGDDRNDVFTNLIRHCYPLANDQPQTLQKEQFSQQRLVEIAMLAPQWIDFIQQVLQWDGFSEACYYFIAHMKQYPHDQKKAQIAHYTQLDPQDLSDGAFDMEWCQRIYQLLGEKRFQMLYKAAKYLCENSYHTRARKYADACLGKADQNQLYQQMREKRNKDALNAYCIYPLKDEEDLMHRYSEVQRFLKESKQFGAQRQASEKRACEIALMNLARNSRYKTVTRLSWIMETKMFQQYDQLLKPQQIEDIQAWIELDDFGKNKIIVCKNNRRQASIPAKLKKHPQILQLKEVHNKWNEQQRRSRNMLEQAMVERSIFTHDEIQTIMKNPIVAPMLAKLVLIDDTFLGFYENGCLQGISGSHACSDAIRIAHPYDLYEQQCWHAYQSYLYEHQITQPFKQIFRELYRKLDDELDQSSSKRYSGYQIQPKKAAAALKAKKWNVSYENGLEKIYYLDHLIVHLYAQADWFSPSDIEAPCIDYVQFVNKDDHTPVALTNINDIVFSETMRDIDLAVSSAYVGGVDPITSFSTMELRKTIIQYTVHLMKLSNVELSDHFANIHGTLNHYSVHLGSGVIHQKGGAAIHLVTVWSQQRGKVYLPFLDEDPKTAEILSKIVLLAQDASIKDPSILSQIQTKR